MRHVMRVIAISVCTLASIAQAVASPVFTGLGALPDGPLYSRAHGISGDGTTVVGESGSPNIGYNPTSYLAFRWTESAGIQFVGVPSTSSRAIGVSHDGAVVVGYGGFPSTAFRWQDGTASWLLPLPGEMQTTSAADVSDDGSVVVGSVFINWRSQGARWDGGVTLYPDAVFCAITRVGGQEIISGRYNGPALFRDGSPQPLGYLGPSPVYGWHYGFALDVSANGRVAVGYSTSPRASDDWGEAFRWTSREGMTGLGDLPGGDFGSGARATSANGGVVVGNSATRYSPTYRGIQDAFYWTPVAGMQKLSTLLTQGFGLNLNGWHHLEDATGVSDSGLVIAGWGTRPNGTEEAFHVKLQQQIYINWDDRMSTGWSTKRNAAGQEISITVPGTWPTLNFPAQLPNGMTPDQYKDKVIFEVSAIFFASGVEIDILDSRRDAWRSAALEVKFGPSVLSQQGKSMHDGRAWDVTPMGLPHADRFNARWDGEVAIFLDLGSNMMSPAHVADIIAHEVGHGLGLRHVRGAKEVMDYTYNQGDLEQFNDVVSQIVEPPTPSGTPWTETHNPYYHLKRYVLGEDPESTQPGTWDLGSITIQKFEITNINHAGNLHNVTPGAAAGSADGELGCETWSNVAYFAEVDPAVDTLSFYNYADFPLSIFASSQPGDLWDIVFGTGDAENPVLTFENLATGPLDGLLFQYDAGRDTYDVVGSFSGTVAEELTLWGQDPEPIPEPATMVLLALAGLAGLVWRLPGVARRQAAA